MFTENAIFFISYIIKQKTSPHHCENVPCDSDRIQTCNLLIRSQMLYSVELRSQIVKQIFMKYRDSDRIQTCNLLIRSQMLYSVELRSHCPFI